MYIKYIGSLLPGQKLWFLREGLAGREVMLWPNNIAVWIWLCGIARRWLVHIIRRDCPAKLWIWWLVSHCSKLRCFKHTHSDIPPPRPSLSLSLALSLSLSFSHIYILAGWAVCRTGPETHTFCVLCIAMIWDQCLKGGGAPGRASFYHPGPCHMTADSYGGFYADPTDQDGQKQLFCQAALLHPLTDSRLYARILCPFYRCIYIYIYWVKIYTSHKDWVVLRGRLEALIEYDEVSSKQITLV